MSSNKGISATHHAFHNCSQDVTPTMISLAQICEAKKMLPYYINIHRDKLVAKLM